MYVCGPTVYNYAHIGKARPAVVFDLLARLLRHDYPEVIYARNLTDVDDKINAAAVAANVCIDTITNRYIDAHHEDMESLGVQAPDLEPCVTGHIPDIIQLIETLIARDQAYVAEQHVFFMCRRILTTGIYQGGALKTCWQAHASKWLPISVIRRILYSGNPQLQIYQAGTAPWGEAALAGMSSARP